MNTDYIMIQHRRFGDRYVARLTDEGNEIAEIKGPISHEDEGDVYANMADYWTNTTDEAEPLYDADEDWRLVEPDEIGTDRTMEYTISLYNLYQGEYFSTIEYPDHLLRQNEPDYPSDEWDAWSDARERFERETIERAVDDIKRITEEQAAIHYPNVELSWTDEYLHRDEDEVHEGIEDLLERVLNHEYGIIGTPVE